jgi:hypothetical protein
VSQARFPLSPALQRAPRSSLDFDSNCQTAWLQTNGIAPVLYGAGYAGLPFSALAQSEGMARQAAQPFPFVRTFLAEDAAPLGAPRRCLTASGPRFRRLSAFP